MGSPILVIAVSERLDITALLLQWNAGDKEALGRLTPVVYDELRLLARTLLRRERSGHTLSATALVHEVYLKLVDQQRASWENRAHFFGAAATMMRRILIDHAKRRLAGKRSAGSAAVPLEAIANEEGIDLGGHLDGLVELDDALTRLEKIDGRKAQVVEMKFFAGMANPEIAHALGVSHATVERDWTMARAWLIHAMRA